MDKTINCTLIITNIKNAIAIVIDSNLNKMFINYQIQVVMFLHTFHKYSAQTINALCILTARSLTLNNLS